MSIPKKHHYIPEFYLRCFTDPLRSEHEDREVLWVYEMHKEIRKSTPKNEAHERDFYAFEEAGEKKRDMEMALSRVESAIAPIFRELDDSKFVFSESLKQDFAPFLALMFTRVPAHREHTDREFVQFIKAWMKEKAKDQEKFKSEYERFVKETGHSGLSVDDLRKLMLEGDYEIEQTSAAFNLQTMMDTTTDLAPVIHSMNWEILCADDDENFLTCDNPVVTAFPERNSMRFGVGFGIMGVEVSFPLSRSYALLMTHGGPEGRSIVTPEGVRDINKRCMVFAKRFVYASVRRDGMLHAFEKIGGKIKYGENAFLPIRPLDFSRLE